MASVLPPKLNDLVAFLQDHIATWSVAPGSIGLTTGQISSITTQLNNTTDLITAHGTAYAAARAATLARNDAGSDLRALAADAIRSIKTYAEAQPKPNVVYAAANIPAPQPPGPTPPPAQPTDVQVSIEPLTGYLTLKWKASNPGVTGVSYIIRRRPAGETGWTFAGVTGTKEFTDSGFIAGPDSVEYMIEGTRSGVNGPPAGITIRFGAEGGDGFSTTVLEAPKLAA